MEEARARMLAVSSAVLAAAIWTITPIIPRKQGVEPAAADNFAAIDLASIPRIACGKLKSTNARRVALFKLQDVPAGRRIEDEALIERFFIVPDADLSFIVDLLRLTSEAGSMRPTVGRNFDYGR